MDINDKLLFMSRQANKAQMLAVYEEQFSADGTIEIRLHGHCMWPIVRSGDIIKIQKASPSDLEFGDVIVFKTSDQSLHVNTQFIRKSKIVENLKRADHYVGKVTELKRGARTIVLDDRSRAYRIFQTIISPANPYLLGLPKTILKKLQKKDR